MGQVHRALTDAKAYHDTELKGLVDNFLGIRNALAHKTAVTLVPIDLVDAFAAGRRLALMLWCHLLKETEGHRLANP